MFRWIFLAVLGLINLYPITSIQARHRRHRPGVWADALVVTILLFRATAPASSSASRR
jgi:hypothetical protein